MLKDKNDVKRNRRLFGNLLSHLKSAKKDLEADSNIVIKKNDFLNQNISKKKIHTNTDKISLKNRKSTGSKQMKKEKVKERKSKKEKKTI